MAFRFFIELLRPRQWIKNLFVVAPLVFSFSFFEPDKIGMSFAAFVFFCAMSSGIYILNDIVDVKADRAHPTKRHRPIARGAVSVTQALAAAVVLVSGVFFFSSFIFGVPFIISLAAYFVLNLLYSFWLKNVFLLDMFFVSIGFVIRVIAGVIAVGAVLSPWILGVTFFIALFIISSKRFQEFKLVLVHSRRPVMVFYTQEFLRQIMFVSLILTISIFLFYAFLEVKSTIFLVTVLPVTYGLFRFLWLVEEGSATSDNPTDIMFQDRQLQLAVALFIVFVILIFSLRFTSYAALFFILS